MKIKIITGTLALLLTVSTAFAQKNIKECRSYRQADLALDSVYSSVISMYSYDKEFLKDFKLAQIAWLKYRTAYLESRFSDDDKFNTYGSMVSPCYCVIMEQMTKDRITQIQQWIDGTDEDDVCAGSIKIK